MLNVSPSKSGNEKTMPPSTLCLLFQNYPYLVQKLLDKQNKQDIGEEVKKRRHYLWGHVCIHKNFKKITDKLLEIIYHMVAGYKFNIKKSIVFLNEQTQNKL